MVSVSTLGSGEGMLHPFRTPGLSRRCRRTGRTGAPPPDPRTDTPLAEGRRGGSRPPLGGQS